MRKWLIIGGFACLVAAALWLSLRSRGPVEAAPPTREARTAPTGATRHDYPTPGETRPGTADPGAGPAASAPRPTAPRGRSHVPQFDPFLDQLCEAALAGNLEKAAAENGVRLKGGQVRVVIRPTMGDGDKVRDAVKALGGEVARTVERGDSEPTLVAWVPARSLRTLAENQAVRNLHRPVGAHANEAREQKAPRGEPPLPVPAP
jgi:hypothetical protein